MFKSANLPHISQGVKESADLKRATNRFNLSQDSEMDAGTLRGPFDSRPTPQSVPENQYADLNGVLFKAGAEEFDAYFAPLEGVNPDSSMEPMQTFLAPHQQPRVLVMPHAMIPGFGFLEGGRAFSANGLHRTQQMPCVPLHQLFRTQWEDDVHFVQYSILAPGHNPGINNLLHGCPRLTKACLKYLADDLQYIPNRKSVVGNRSTSS